MHPCFLVVDKPVGITSHDVVAMVRAVTGVKKVGHTGTLDPFATGVLALAIGPATRLIQYLDESVKIYDATISLGSATDTGDPTGEVERTLPVPDLTEAHVVSVLAGFRGERMQTPPRHSAVKVRGRPLYAYARAGEDVRAKPRPIRIDSIELLELDGSRLRVLIRCGRGTYARVLADEIASELGTAGHLAALHRVRSGPFTNDGALTLPGLSELVAGRADWQAVMRPARGEERVKWFSRQSVRDGLAPFIMNPLVALAHLPVVPVRDPDARRMRSGAAPPAPPVSIEAGQVYIAANGGALIAVVRREAEGARTLRVMPAE